MKKNVYQILQDWHELLKSGVITDEEFSAKKKELLGEEKQGQKDDQRKDAFQQEEIIIRSPEEQELYDREYENLFAKKNWFQKNKILLFICIIILTVSTFLYFKLIAVKKDDQSIEPETNIPINQAKQITLILENNERMRLDRFPKGFLDQPQVSDSAIHCLIDIDNDNSPELITEYFTGGAHCCYVTDIFTKLSNNNFKRIFSYNGEISIKKSGLSLYFFEDVGYFHTCYACGDDSIISQNTVDPLITLKFHKGSFDFADKNESLNEKIEEKLKALKDKGIPDLTDTQAFPQDDGTRRAYAINVIAYFFNNNRDVEKTRKLFYDYYNHKDSLKIWEELERYINSKKESLKKKINFEIN